MTPMPALAWPPFPRASTSVHGPGTPLGPPDVRPEAGAAFAELLSQAESQRSAPAAGSDDPAGPARAAAATTPEPADASALLAGLLPAPAGAADTADRRAAAPSFTPSFTPSVSTSLTPSAGPSIAPSVAPSVAPTVAPSFAPSVVPPVTLSVAPSFTPSPTTSAPPLADLDPAAGSPPRLAEPAASLESAADPEASRKSDTGPAADEPALLDASAALSGVPTALPLTPGPATAPTASPDTTVSAPQTNDGDQRPTAGPARSALSRSTRDVAAASAAGAAPSTEAADPGALPATHGLAATRSSSPPPADFEVTPLERATRASALARPAASSGNDKPDPAVLIAASAGPGPAAPGADGPLPTPGRLQSAVGTPAFVTELGLQLSTYARDGVQHARLELHPLELGPMTVQIQLDGPGARIDFAAEHAQTRRALEDALPQLAASLREAGLTLSGGGVFEQPRQPQPQAQQQPQARSGREGPDTRPDARPGAPGSAGGRPQPAPWRRRGVVDLVA